MNITAAQLQAAWYNTINYEGRHRRSPFELSPVLKKFLTDTEGLRHERRDRSRDRLPV